MWNITRLPRDTAQLRWARWTFERDIDDIKTWTVPNWPPASIDDETEPTTSEATSTQPVTESTTDDNLDPSSVPQTENPNTEPAAPGQMNEFVIVAIIFVALTTGLAITTLLLLWTANRNTAKLPKRDNFSIPRPVLVENV